MKKSKINEPEMAYVKVASTSDARYQRINVLTLSEDKDIINDKKNDVRWNIREHHKLKDFNEKEVIETKYKLKVSGFRTSIHRNESVNLITQKKEVIWINIYKEEQLVAIAYKLVNGIFISFEGSNEPFRLERFCHIFRKIDKSWDIKELFNYISLIFKNREQCKSKNIKN